MEINSEVFNYHFLNHKDELPVLLDCEAVGLDCNDIEEIKKDKIKWGSVAKNTPDGTELTIVTEVCLPCKRIQSFVPGWGTFYVYKSQTKFLVLKENVTIEMIAELTLVHLGRQSLLITIDTMKKNNGIAVYPVALPCLSKLILTGESILVGNG